MDVSKLPRLSQTPEPPPVPAPQTNSFCTGCGAPLAPDTKFCGACGQAVDSRGPGSSYAVPPYTDAWLGVAIGLILLLIYPRLLQYVSHRLFGTHFAPYINFAGQEVSYTITPDFPSDIGITLFAVTVLADGLMLLCIRRPIAILIALGLTAISTLYNLGFLVTHFNPLPIVSALAVAMGVYFFMSQLNQYRQTRLMGQSRGPLSQ